MEASRNMSLEDRVKRLERSYQHLLTVMATQRESIGNAFSEMQTSMLEQEVTLRSHCQKMEKAVVDVQSSMLQQEVALKTHLLDLQATLEDLDNRLLQHEERLRHLEEKPPPAA